MDDEVERIRAYHRGSKHHLHRYAPGPGRLDWATQPDPFRRFEGTATCELPLLADGLRTSFAALRRSHGVAPHPVDLDRIAVLLEVSLGLSAWKHYQSSRWALRCNPSSGNLHPTEGYVVCPPVAGLAGGVHHYVSRDHLLEQRAALETDAWASCFRARGVLVAITSIFWREAWKYGVRAYRYCQHDAGHAIAAIRYAAAAIGWQARVLERWSDDEIARLVGIHRPDDFLHAEHESPDAVLWIGPELDDPDPGTFMRAIQESRWSGRANRLSPRHVPWPLIDDAEKAARKRNELPANEEPPDIPALTGLTGGSQRAASLFRQRRSAVALDGRTRIARDAFYEMLDACLPRRGVAPFDAISWAPRIHPVLFVHRVDDLQPGLYMLPRTPAVADRARELMRPDWVWAPAPGRPPHLDLRLLVPIDTRDAATTVACHQDIAADGCFAVGMLAELDRSLEEGAFRYRHLHWEAGMLGHVLYLEAEAAGIRGTGIGCFFDDAMHELLGLETTGFQTLYHFTVGGPVEDRRLRTEPPYGHLEGRRQTPLP